LQWQILIRDKKPIPIRDRRGKTVLSLLWKYGIFMLWISDHKWQKKRHNDAERDKKNAYKFDDFEQFLLFHIG